MRDNVMSKNSFLSNFIWRFAERCGAQLVTFIVSVVLARILVPEDYGQIALITVFTTIMQVFVDSGLGTALIQKKDADDLDFSSVFYAIKAMGRSDLFLKLEIAKKIVGMALLLSTMWFGVMAMAYSLLVSSVLSQIINSWPNRKLLNYGYLEQLKDILPGIALAVFMGCCVNIVTLFQLSNVVTLLIQIPMGAVIYIATSSLLHLESFEYLMDMTRPMVRKIIRK